jgi:methylated-DNA-[protein]-cysteine S-methyltransferase
MMVRRFYSELATPVGPVTLVSDGARLTTIMLLPAAAVVPANAEWRESAERLAEARAQLTAYFAGELQDFSLPLAPEGTSFQRAVWSALRQIPFGVTTTYGALAASLGQPGAARAVGAANRLNPHAIVVPCHRVIGSNGRLTGYAGGLERKAFLLAHEARVLAATRRTPAPARAAAGGAQLPLGLAASR